MKILIYSLNFKPEKIGIGKYSGELADYLYKKGHELRVICSPEYYPKWETDKNKYCIENKNIYPIYRCPIFIPKLPNGIKRILHLFSFSISSFPILLTQISWKPDLIILVAPTLFCAFNVLIFRLLSLKRILYLLHIQDFELEIAFSLKILKGKFLKNLMLKLELFIFRKFDFVSTISNSMMRLLISKGVDKEKVLYLPNWVDLAEIKGKNINDKKQNIFRKKLKISSTTVTIQYSGSMNKKQGLNHLLPIMEYFKDNKNLLWLFAGEGPTKKEFIHLTRNIPNVKILSLQDSRDMSDWLNAGDIHIIPQSKKIDNLLFPSKLLTILASGNPVVSNTISKSDLGDIVEKVGIRVNVDDQIGFINALNSLYKNEEYRLNLGKKARKYAEKNFNKETILNDLNTFLEESHFYFKKENID